MNTFVALLTLCAGNSPVTSEFPSQRPVPRSFGVFFIICAWINSILPKINTWLISLAIQIILSWWRHQMETFSALLAICEGNSPVPDEFPTQRPVTRSFDVFFDLRLNKRLSKQYRGWWFETSSRPFWRHCYDITQLMTHNSCTVDVF